MKPLIHIKVSIAQYAGREKENFLKKCALSLKHFEGNDR